MTNGKERGEDMKLKRNWFTNSTVILYMLLLIGVLAAAVYYPFIYSKNDMFPVLLVSGIVIFIFLIAILIIKLISVERQETNSIIKIVIETFFVLLVMFLAFYIRTAPTVVFTKTDTVLFDVAAMLQKNVTLSNTTSLYLNIMKDPSLFGYGKLVSFFFLFFGTRKEVLLYMNLITQLLAIFFAYRFVRRITGRVCANIALLFGALLPSHIFDTYSMSNDMLFACLFFGAMWLFTYLFQEYKNMKIKILGILCYILLGILLGVMVFFEPVSAVFVLILCIILFCSGLQYALCSLIMLFFFGGSLTLQMFGMAQTMKMSLYTVAEAYLCTFIPDKALFMSMWMNNLKMFVYSFGNAVGVQGEVIVENYAELRFFDTLTLSLSSVYWLQLINQIVYLILILFAIVGSGFLLRIKKTYALIPTWLGIGSIVYSFFSMKNGVDSFHHMELVVIIALVGMYNIHYVFAGLGVEDEFNEAEGIMEQHDNTEEKSEQHESVKEEQEQQEEQEQHEQHDNTDGILEQQVVIEDISEQRNNDAERIAEQQTSDEDINGQQDEQKEQKPEAINYIENPLPLPKKHVPRRIDYAIEPTHEQMCYDIEVDEHADWDI